MTTASANERARAHNRDTELGTATTTEKMYRKEAKKKFSSMAPLEAVIVKYNRIALWVKWDGVETRNDGEMIEAERENARDTRNTDDNYNQKIPTRFIFI